MPVLSTARVIAAKSATYSLKSAESRTYSTKAYLFSHRSRFRQVGSSFNTVRLTRRQGLSFMRRPRFAMLEWVKHVVVTPHSDRRMWPVKPRIRVQRDKIILMGEVYLAEDPKL